MQVENKNKNKILIVSGVLLVIILFIAISFIVHNTKNIIVSPDNSKTESILEEQTLDNRDIESSVVENDVEEDTFDKDGSIEKGQDDNTESQENVDDSLEAVPATEQPMAAP